MEASTPLTSQRSPLHDELARAGANFGDVSGFEIATDFGSVAGEVAICRRAAGIVDRSDLLKLDLRGSPETLAQLLERVAGARPEPTSFLRSGGLRFCPFGAYHLLVIGPLGAEQRQRELLLGQVRRLGERASCREAGAEYATIAVAGARAELIVATAAGVEAPLGVGDSLARLLIGERPVYAMRESPTQFVLIAAAGDAPGLWRRLHQTGSALGASHVGRHALARFLVGERLQLNQENHRPLLL